MLLLLLASLVSGDTVKFNTILADVEISMTMGGEPQTFTTDSYGRMLWMKNPNNNELQLTIGADTYKLRTSATGAGYAGCNYNFEIFGVNEMYQNTGMECTKIFDKAEAMELYNDMGKPVYPAFNTGWGFASDSILGWLGDGMTAVYAPGNGYLEAIGAKAGTELEVGYFDQTKYLSCGKATVGKAFVKSLSECTGAAQRSFHAASSSGSKLHTLDQEYHMKETNSDAAWQKDEDWSRKERKEKESKVGEPGSNMNTDARYGRSTDARYGRNYVGRAGHAATQSGLFFQASSSTSDWFVYGFALAGVGFVAKQGYDMVFKKSSEFAPLQQKV